MKNLRRSLVLLLLFYCSSLGANIREIDERIAETKLDLKATVGICVLNRKTSEVAYDNGQYKLLNPASILKVLTFGAAYKILGKNFKFETILYKDPVKNLYLKLSGDTLLSSENLIELFTDAKNKIGLSEIGEIYIDDTIIDKTSYPPSWMREDIWPCEKTITPYIVDRNRTKISIKRSDLASKVDIVQNDTCKIPIVNELKPGDKQNIKIERVYGQKVPTLSFKGSVAQNETRYLPVINPEISFKTKVRSALSKAGITYSGKIRNKKVPKNALKIASVAHSIGDISRSILYDSDNFAAEVVFKVGAAKYIGYMRSATLNDAIHMFNDVYKNILEEGIRVVDGSGVSRYNLLNAHFAAGALLYLSQTTDILNLMESAGEGTLTNRMLPFSNNLKAKTGTLSRISSLLGVINTSKKNDLVFCVIIQNSPKKDADLKTFEDDLVTILHKEY